MLGNRSGTPLKTRLAAASVVLVVAMGAMLFSALRSASAESGAYEYGPGYWLASADGGVFAYGHAGYNGSPGGDLRAPIAGLAPTIESRQP